MKILIRLISFRYLNAILLILILAFALVNNKMKSNSEIYAVQNSFLKTELFSKEYSKLSVEKPIKSDKEDKKEQKNLINVEEEVDFLDSYHLPMISDFTTLKKIQPKIIQQEKFIELFHPELIVRPPKV